MDPQMNDLFKWSIENSRPSTDPTSTVTPPSSRPLNAAALQSLMGGPSDADLMKESMAAIISPEISLPNKLVAFDNFEQLIETIDNANNMESLGLWTPLVGLLKSEQAELRRMAAWCVGTAVQNNSRGQERLLVMKAIPALVQMALEDLDDGARRKAIYALSSEARNYQPGTDAMVELLPEGLGIGPGKNIDAGNMDALDRIVEDLREKSRLKAS